LSVSLRSSPLLPFFNQMLGLPMKEREHSQWSFGKSGDVRRQAEDIEPVTAAR